MSDLIVETTEIPGLLVLRMPVHGDARGWFKENWHREKMVAAGLPDFAPVQQNVSWNAQRGATRGVHAEPWDKLISVGSGRVFAAWVDLRAGRTHGRTTHVEIGPGTAVFVPRGVGNSYQALEDGTTYTYLVNDHWRRGRQYPAVNLADAHLAIPWPIPLADAEISEKDKTNPGWRQIDAMPPPSVLVLGARGQLGRALCSLMPHAHGVDQAHMDLSDAEAVARWPWADYDHVINAAAFTAVDDAETIEGRRVAWVLNASVPAQLAQLADLHRFRLVHVSTDYVFDGTLDRLYTEDDPVCPLGIYGQTKAAGELAVLAARRHHVVRTSRVVGEGHNFVRTMADLADHGVSPEVVDDQRARLTFADELARAIDHLLISGADPGLYHVTNAGPVASFCDVARRVFEVCGRDPDDVTPVTTEQYNAGRRAAPRPLNSALDLSRMRASGFEPEDAEPVLDRYLASLR